LTLTLPIDRCTYYINSENIRIDRSNKHNNFRREKENEHCVTHEAMINV